MIDNVQTCIRGETGRFNNHPTSLLPFVSNTDAQLLQRWDCAVFVASPSSRGER